MRMQLVRELPVRGGSWGPYRRNQSKAKPISWLYVPQRLEDNIANANVQVGPRQGLTTRPS
jgi:hypothetical protein